MVLAFKKLIELNMCILKLFHNVILIKTKINNIFEKKCVGPILFKKIIIFISLKFFTYNSHNY